VPSREEQAQRVVMGLASNVNASLGSPRHARVQRQADPCKCVVVCQCLRKVRSAGGTELIAAEIELCQAERSKASIVG